MIVGGELPFSGSATDTAEIIDYSDATPSWTYTNPMHFARKHFYGLILPDGKVFVASGGLNEFTPVFTAEMFDPATETWTIMDSARSDFRLYHSSSVLLPDGRAMWLGGQVPDDVFTAEIYSPGYLFKGPRPTITSTVSSVQYGSPFSIVTPDATDITSVVFIRPSATTHSRNMTQRYVQISFAQGVPGTLDATAPSNPNVAPPGYYMLFVLNSNGVPSVAEFVHLTP